MQFSKSSTSAVRSAASPCHICTETYRIAAVSLMNGSATEDQIAAAIEDAKKNGITTSQYLRARLLLKAGIQNLGTAMDDDW